MFFMIHVIVLTRSCVELYLFAECECLLFPKIFETAWLNTDYSRYHFLGHTGFRINMHVNKVNEPSAVYMLCFTDTPWSTVWHLDASCNPQVISCGESGRVKSGGGGGAMGEATDFSRVQSIVDNVDCEMSQHEYKIFVNNNFVL